MCNQILAHYQGKIMEQLSLLDAGSLPNRVREITNLTPEEEQEVIARALGIAKDRCLRGDPITNPNEMRDFLILRFTGRLNEVFAVLFLDNRHRILAFEELFHGTIAGASVHPRVVVQRALHHNAAAVVFAHNHPSGIAEPSQADKTITTALINALALIDVRTLDHFIIGGGETFSFAEHGLL
jgi:DNA repair protein RadC